MQQVVLEAKIRRKRSVTLSWFTTINLLTHIRIIITTTSLANNADLYTYSNLPSQDDLLTVLLKYWKSDKQGYGAAFEHTNC